MKQRIHEMHTPKGWGLMGLMGSIMIIAVPLLNILPSSESFFYIPDYLVTLFGKILCYALVALALDLVWGYTGILSLGHGLFFALGGYAMGMHLMRNIGTEGVYKSALPDFMVFLDWKELPWYWHGFDKFPFAMLMVILVPGVLAWVFGFFAFRSRIKGVYFAIVTQALTFAAMLLFFRNNTGFGGNNGLTDFKRILGFSLQDPSTKLGLYVLTGLVLIIFYIFARFIVTSKLGRIIRAIRDAENRVIFSGYDAFKFKLFIWTLSAVVCGIAGALYVPQVGIINPSEMQPSNSIEIVIWVAIGGRGTLLGPILGAIVVNGAKSWFTVAYPEFWLYFLGGLFVLVTVFLPRGLIGILSQKNKEPLRGRT
ncbi:urea ABC transporter permease subunit UrtC [PVC group bacterium]|nr:urea ABC transporter permease subunit UrtC [PVC group bacterium]